MARFGRRFPITPYAPRIFTILFGGEEPSEALLSLMNFCLENARVGHTLPAADDSIGQGDRQHLLDLYSEILADPPPAAGGATAGSLALLGVGI